MSRSPHDRASSAALEDELAGLWSGLSGRDDPATPTDLVALAAAVLPDSDATCLMLRRHDENAEVLATSSPLGVRIADLQDELEQGPCVDPVSGTSVVRVDDLLTDERWPDFAAACVAQTGMRSTLCIRTPIGRRDEAALCFYAREPAAFSADDAVTGSIFAPMTAMAVKRHLRDVEIHQLESARGSARSIGTAVAFLMEDEGLDRSAALSVLRRAGADGSAGLSDVADGIVRDHYLRSIP